MVGLNLGIFLKFIWSPWALNMYLKVPQIVQEVLTLMARPKQVQKMSDFDVIIWGRFFKASSFNTRALETYLGM
jgi:hypothetical protein